MFSGVPSINNWNSIFNAMHRPLVYAALNGLHSNLPLIPMTYHPNFTPRTDNLLTDKGNVKYPKVIKVASTHSGYGKIRVRNDEDMSDVRSLLILNKDFYTTEPLQENILNFAFKDLALTIEDSSVCQARHGKIIGAQSNMLTTN